MTVRVNRWWTILFLQVQGQAVFHGSPFKLFVKSTKQYQPLTTCKGLQKWVIDAPQSRLDPINAQYGNPQLDYKNKDGSIRKDTAYFYFAGNGSSCNTGLLQRPIVFIDGFDPTNSRGVQQIYEGYINIRVDRNGIPGGVLFGDYMLTQGYDFVILDFKHGNDLLERNAMTLVSLLERLNQTYGGTMQQGITLIGPSMGSLVAQYALAYMERNNIAHNVKTYISFDGCHQGANVPIGLQEFVEYFTRKGIFKKNKAIREGLYNGLAARQMLAHHVSAKSHFPAPDALRNTFLQNLTAVGEYPQQCRKVALIDGSRAGIINEFHPNPSETLLHIAVKRKGWKSLWGACSDKICEKLDWNCYTGPNSGTAKVMENWTVEPEFNLLFWVPLGMTNKYADAAWGNSSLDNSPGGTFGTFFGSNPGDINESNFVFLLKEAMYLITGSKRTTFSQNINQFTMMPSYSAADLRFPSMTDNSGKNLYMRFDDKYLCGHTPFNYVYAPMANPHNQQHVLVSAEASQWFENEVKCNIGDLPTLYNPQINGNSSFCGSSETYSIQTCNNSPLSITWSVTPSGIVSITPNGSSVTLNKISTGTITLTATNSSNCQDPFTLTKQIIVGAPAIQGYYVAQANGSVIKSAPILSNQLVSVSVPRSYTVQYSIELTSNLSSVTWNLYGVGNITSMTSTHLYWTMPASGSSPNNCTVVLNAINGSCPVSGVYPFQVIGLAGYGYTMIVSPNPATDNINVQVTQFADTSSAVNSIDAATTKKSTSSVVTTNSTTVSNGSKTNFYLCNLYSNAVVKQWQFQDTKSDNYNLNISGISSGTYILKMEKNNKTTTSKVIVQ